MNDARLSKLASEGNKRAIRLEKLTSQPARFLATIQVAITLAGFLGSAFAADTFSEPLVTWIVSLSPDALAKYTGVFDAVSVVVITVILSYFTLVFGELVPKRVAQNNPEKIALGISGLVSFIATVFSPIVWVLTVSTNGVLRVLGIDPNADQEEVTEEEIRMMVDAGSEKGAIDEEEKEIIQNVFEFDDLAIEELATHRTNVTLLWMDETPEQWEQTIHESRHTIYPVCEESIDNVVGTLDAKDYFRLKDKSRENVLKNAVTPAYFVPGSVKADVLFKNMKSGGNTFAVVIDEYGGMTGIITMSDLVQALVGDFDTDETGAAPEEEIEKLDSGTWKILGGAAMDEVCEALGVAIEESEDYETFGGYVFATYGSVPDDGSTFELETDELVVKVTEIKDHRVVKALVTVVEKSDDEDEDNEKDEGKKSRRKSADED